MLDGYDHEYLGLLDRDADGMGVWRVGENMTAVAHPSDVTVGFFLRLLRGEYGDAVLDPSHVVVVVNAFWSGNGERVGQPWEFGLKREAREVLGRDGDWDKVYCCRRARVRRGRRGHARSIVARAVATVRREGNAGGAGDGDGTE